MVRQAREWESSGEYARAVECYLKVTTNLTTDINVLEKCWMKVLKIQQHPLTKKCVFGEIKKSKSFTNIFLKYSVV